jgi:hypothetical protein
MQTLNKSFAISILMLGIDDSEAGLQDTISTMMFGVAGAGFSSAGCPGADSSDFWIGIG